MSGSTSRFGTDQLLNEREFQDCVGDRGLDLLVESWQYLRRAVPAERGHSGVRGGRLRQKAPLVLPPPGDTGAAVDHVDPAGDPRGLVGGKEQDQVGDIIRGSEAS
jgi:hypothetical protein